MDYQRMSRPREPFSDRFPFWRLTSSIALGVLIANAVTWLAAEIRLGYETAQLAEQLSRETEQMKRDVVVSAQQRQREQRAMEARQQTDAEERITRMEGPLLPAANASLAIGQIGCLDGYQVKRESNGWSDVVVGMRQKCRVRR